MFQLSRHFENERGQAMTAALIALPLALTIFCGAMFFAFAFVIEAKATAACRSSMMNSQTHAAEAINNLLALNTEAETAERAMKVAETGLRIARASKFPVAIIFAEGVHKAASMYQYYVMGRQQRWLLQGKIYSRLATADAANDVRKSLPDGMLSHAIKNIFSDLSAFSTPHQQTPLFHVIASPPRARTPTYRTAPDFEKTQVASVQWLLPLPISKTRGFQDRDRADAFDPKIEVGCTVALKKKGEAEWYPQITENKLVRD